MRVEQGKIDQGSVLPRLRHIVETLFNCNWSLTFMLLMERGSHQPSRRHRSVDGLSSKVMNHCLTKLESNLIVNTTYLEMPPRAAYDFTPFGFKFTRGFDVIEEWDREWSGSPAPAQDQTA